MVVIVIVVEFVVEFSKKNKIILGKGYGCLLK